MHWRYFLQVSRVPGFGRVNQDVTAVDNPGRNLLHVGRITANPIDMASYCQYGTPFEYGSVRVRGRDDTVGRRECKKAISGLGID
jgi:hypothetical protein